MSWLREMRLILKWRNLIYIICLGFLISLFRTFLLLRAEDAPDLSQRKHAFTLPQWPFWPSQPSTTTTGPVYDFYYVNEADVFVPPENLPTQSSQDKLKPKLILAYGDFFGDQFGEANLAGCRELACQISTDKNLASRADAIIFHMVNFGGMPAQRYTWQRYIFFMLESAANYPMKHIDSKSGFNWTMTYRFDSDMICPYGYTMKRSKPIKIDLTNDIKHKRKPIAWFVSNCGGVSQRRRYVDALAQYIPVDIYGGCGNLSCPKGRACEDMLNTEYYFYLAFENSICKHYVTEKFWQKAAPGRLIPIVLKRSVLSPLAPPTSFIAADDFANPKELADYLKSLMAAPEKYVELLKWREEFDIIYLNGTFHDQLEKPFGFCEICRKLWDPEEATRHKVYSDIGAWWETESACDSTLVDKLLTAKIFEGGADYDKDRGNKGVL